VRASLYNSRSCTTQPHVRACCAALTRGHAWIAWIAEEAKLEKEKVYEVRNKELASQMEVLMTQKLENERCVDPCRSFIPIVPTAHKASLASGGWTSVRRAAECRRWSLRRRKQEAAEVLARQKRELREMTLEEKVIHERMLAEAKLIDRKKALTQKEIIKEKQRKQRDKLLLDKAKKMEENRIQYEMRLEAEVR
jgi:hypothetical protein